MQIKFDCFFCVSACSIQHDLEAQFAIRTDNEELRTKFHQERIRPFQYGTSVISNTFKQLSRVVPFTKPKVYRTIKVPILLIIAMLLVAVYLVLVPVISSSNIVFLVATLILLSNCLIEFIERRSNLKRSIFLFGGIYIPCAFDRTVLAHWELMLHQVAPTLLIMFGCVPLFVRVMLQKIRARQQIEWRKHRKMILQVLTISSVYIVFNLPWFGVIFAYEFGLLPQLVTVDLTVSKFIIYNIIFFCPIVCCLSLSELRTKFTQQIKYCRRHQRVGQAIIITNQSNLVVPPTCIG
ncbi:unnamed protein product [Rotaria socialis]|uniref:G-protein coupled receptors family 1 profile domain-containing protein n=1 Tax=Rotaria socialis TaxID=392032 RepID=A0A821QGA6_9BILA|nr:unnamed protein product [Rotaria socialis]